jgi:hypothetical protein
MNMAREVNKTPKNVWKLGLLVFRTAGRKFSVGVVTGRRGNHGSIPNKAKTIFQIVTNTSSYSVDTGAVSPMVRGR